MWITWTQEFSGSPKYAFESTPRHSEEVGCMAYHKWGKDLLMGKRITTEYC